MSEEKKGVTHVLAAGVKKKIIIALIVILTIGIAAGGAIAIKSKKVNGELVTPIEVQAVEEAEEARSFMADMKGKFGALKEKVMAIDVPFIGEEPTPLPTPEETVAMVDPEEVAVYPPETLSQPVQEVLNEPVPLVKVVPETPVAALQEDSEVLVEPIVEVVPVPGVTIEVTQVAEPTAFQKSFPVASSVLGITELPGKAELWFTIDQCSMEKMYTALSLIETTPNVAALFTGPGAPAFDDLFDSIFKYCRGIEHDTVEL